MWHRVDELHRRAAIYVDRVLRGAKPADLPVEQAARFDLAINRGTAQGLRIAIPPSLLLRADHLVQ
jgi:putative ABC transport system substrate-binding protein